MVPVIFGLGVAAADGDGEGDGVRTELAEVCGELGVLSDGISSGEELDPLSPPAGPEHPDTAPSAAPAEPSSSVRRETTLNCGAPAKAAHRIEHNTQGSPVPSGAGTRAWLPVLGHCVASCTGDRGPDVSSGTDHIGVQCSRRSGAFWRDFPRQR